jgi:tRNA-specific 2-thiouridylase
MRKRVVVGLSGGVDSSVAAALLLEQGYDVHGVYLECYNEPGCRTDQDKADALKVALKLGITFEVLDFRKEYRENVIEYFFREYEAGRTPNPDVMCNREIKFGIFYHHAMEQGYDYVATGHYARIQQVLQSSSDPVFQLMMARDESKDQSYFLWQIPKDHLAHILFPLGNMLKSEVRQKAKELGLHTALKPDSMGICFIGEVDVLELLKSRLGENPGEIFYKDRVVGRHRGLWFHTTGERRGFDLDKLALKKLGMHPERLEPMYVVQKNINKNQLIVGTRDEVMRQEFKILDSRLEKRGKGKMWVRIRNLGELIEVEKIEDRVVTLKEKMFGVAEGQSAVFYDKNGVLVDGTIIV